jgi:hypothetical protein
MLRFAPPAPHIFRFSQDGMHPAAGCIAWFGELSDIARMIVDSMLNIYKSYQDCYCLPAAVGG